MNYRLQLLINGLKYYTFIKSDITTVQDLMDHITRTFNIETFTLSVNDSIIMATDDIRVINQNDIVVVRLNNVYQQRLVESPIAIEEQTENPIKEKKSKKRKPCNIPTEIENVDEAKLKKRKMMIFEPSATSSTKRDNIIGSRIQYYNNLSNGSVDEKNPPDEQSKELNIPHADAEQVEESKKLVEKHLKKCINNTPDLITPVLTDANKVGKKKKFKLSNMDMDQAADEMESCEKVSNCDVRKLKSIQENTEPIPSTSKDCEALENTQNKHVKSASSSHSKLIMHITPARDIQPTTHLKKKINLVKSITVKNGLLVSEQNLTNSGSGPVAMETSNSSSNKSTPNISTSTPVRQEDTLEQTPPLNGQKLPEKSPVSTSNDVSSSTHPIHKASTSKINNQEISSEESTPKTITAKSTPSSAKSTDLPASSMSYILARLRNGEAVDGDSNNSKDASNAEDRFITRRKRVRKRQAKKSVHTDTPYPVAHKEQVYRKPNIEMKPLVHKFFDNPDLNSEDEIEDNIDLTNSQEEEEVIIEDSQNLIVFEEKQPEVEQVNGVHKECLAMELAQANIDKLCPLKEDFVPRIGDLIVFQKLKMDSSFSPTLSKHILGEVKFFDPTIRSLKLLIKDGLAEFEEPQGILNDSMLEVDKIQSLQWEHMIHPRLLYP